jgi:hypothetical protein
VDFLNLTQDDDTNTDHEQDIESADEVINLDLTGMEETAEEEDAGNEMGDDDDTINLDFLDLTQNEDTSPQLHQQDNEFKDEVIDLTGSDSDNNNIVDLIGEEEDTQGKAEDDIIDLT